MGDCQNTCQVAMDVDRQFAVLGRDNDLADEGPKSCGCLSAAVMITITKRQM